MKNIFKTVAIITIFTILTRIAGFIFRIWISNEIGPEALGIYQISFSILIVLITICCSGIPLTVSRLNAKYKSLNLEKNKSSMTTSALIIAGLTSIFLCLIILCAKNLISFIFTDEICMIILLTMLPAVFFSSLHGVIRGYLWGENDYLSVCLIELVEQFIRILSCVIMLTFSYTLLQNLISLSLSLSISIFVSLICVFIVYFRKGGSFIFNKNNYKEIIRTSAPITGLRLISSLIMPLISIVIPLSLVKYGYTNNQALELFGIAIGMAYPLLFLPTTIIDSLSITLIPNLSYLKAKNDYTSIKNEINSAFHFTFFISCLFLPIFMTLGTPICQFLFQNEIAGSFLTKASILIIPLSLNNISTSTLNSLNFEKKTLKYFLISCVPMIISLFILPKYIGIDTIIYAILIQSSITSLLNIKLIIQNNFISIKLTKIFTCTIFVSIVLSFIFSNIYNIFSNYLPLFFNIMLISILSCLTYLFFIQTLNLYNVNKLFLTLFKNNKKTHKTI